MAAPTIIQELIDEVAQDQTVIQSAITLLDGIDAMIAAAVEAAEAGDLAPLQDVKTTLAANRQALATAVANVPQTPPPA